MNNTILIITDGIGYNQSDNFNAFANAKTPTYDYLFRNVPNSLLHTYGKSVGLPDGQMGNSEVGHMTIGCGRILYQDLVKINMAIENDTLKNNDVLNDLIDNSNDIHLLGLVSDGGVHSHQDHIIALAKIAKQKNKKVFIHIITDGRDVGYDSSKDYVEKIVEIQDENIKIATISGRYYAMDRDNRWDRVEKAYNAMAFATPSTDLGVLQYIDDNFYKEIYDEFIVPTAFNGYKGFNKNDGIIFCNFRSDRMREISNVIANEDFSEFKRSDVSINVATMTEYDKSFPLPVLFPKTSPKNTLAEVIADAGLSQLHTAETEKYAHVTFFFNGGIEEPVKNESRVLIPSPKVATYDLQPQMSAPEVGEAVREAITQKYDFIVVNFANGDMVGHTGNYEAGIQAVEAVDSEIGKILEKSKEFGYNVIITSDHGNCEMMKDSDGKTLTNHTVGDVFCFIISDKVNKVNDGGLNNIAPSVLKLMNLQIPQEMDEPLF